MQMTKRQAVNITYDSYINLKYVVPCVCVSGSNNRKGIHSPHDQVYSLFVVSYI